MIDRFDNFDRFSDRTDEMLVDAYCKLDEYARGLMDRQKAMVVLMRRLHRTLMQAEDAKSATAQYEVSELSADRLLLECLIQACHETFDAMDALWQE